MNQEQLQADLQNLEIVDGESFDGYTWEDILNDNGIKCKGWFDSEDEREEVKGKLVEKLSPRWSLSFKQGFSSADDTSYCHWLSVTAKPAL